MYPRTFWLFISLFTNNIY
uniref:Uncharacterized protein n=1 Tax=Arundo donax TaxID=35708 RepID=A0A0A9HVZ0_ARUDO